MKPCIPDRLPLEKYDEKHLKTLLEKAHQTLKNFNTLLKRIPHPQEALALLDVAEAIDSVDEYQTKKDKKSVLCPEVFAKNLKKVEPVLNYRKALEFATKTKRSISNSLLLKIHKLVKKGAKKDAGSFRDRQNWIGVIGYPIEKATFLPPEPEAVPAAMKNLQDYLDHEEKDPLIQLAVYFAQLLVIHPFMDGNGRVGRSLLPLFLWKKRLISHPIFYFSGYFKRHHVAYFSKLNKISTNNDWEGWIIFFLEGVVEEGKINCRKVEKLAELYEKWARKLTKHFSPKQTQKILGYLFSNPIFSLRKFAVHIDMPRISQLKAIELLQIREVRGMMVCQQLISAL